MQGLKVCIDNREGIAGLGVAEDGAVGLTLELVLEVVWGVWLKME